MFATWLGQLLLPSLGWDMQPDFEHFTLHNLSSNLFPRASFSSTGPTQPFKTFSSAYFIFRLKPNSITSPFGPRSKATVANIENEP